MKSGGVMDISTTSAVLFVVVASGFLVVLYYLMSAWFVDLLVVLFCIGGVEVGFTDSKKFTSLKKPMLILISYSKTSCWVS